MDRSLGIAVISLLLSSVAICPRQRLSSEAKADTIWMAERPSSYELQAIESQSLHPHKTPDMTTNMMSVNEWR